MIAALVAAAALSNVITAPPGFYAHAEWDQSDHSGVSVIFENRTGRVRNAVTVRCKLYDAAGLIVGAPMRYSGMVDPHEAQHTWVDEALDDHAHPTRFVCHISEGFE